MQDHSGAAVVDSSGKGSQWCCRSSDSSVTVRRDFGSAVADVMHSGPNTTSRTTGRAKSPCVPLIEVRCTVLEVGNIPCTKTFSHT